MKILNKLYQISKAYTEGIYADTPANRKLGRVGMTYAEYAQRLKNKKEEKADKKYWLIQFDSGEEDIFTEDKMSKEKLIEEACKFAKDIAEANDYDKYKFDIQENTNDWKEEDFDKKQYDWLSIRAEKHNGKYEISVYDWRESKYLRNDKLEREKRNLEQKFKRDKEKSEKEFKEKFGWMEELLEYKKKNKTHMTEEEKGYIEQYVSGEGMWINNYLRDPSTDIVLDSKEDKAFLDTLDKITSNKLGEKQTLYRSVDASAFFKDITDFEYDALISTLIYNNKEKLIQKEAGNALKKLQKQITDKGFVSTTKSEEVADEWGDFTGAEHPIILKISTDENTKGYDLGEFDVEGDEQYEVLLGKNQIFEVKNIYGKNGNIYLDVNIR